MKRREFLVAGSSLALGASLSRGALGAAAATRDASGRARIRRGVTLYSYQEEYYQHAMSLEDCLAELNSIGATGVQLIAEEMVPNYPDPPQAWVDQWHGMLAKYRLTPTNLDTFVDVYLGGHRKMSAQEQVDTLVSHLKLAHRLGFRIVRPTTGPVEEPAVAMVERALPFAEKYDVRIAPEIHAPIPLQGKYIQSYVDLIHRTGTKHVGFTLDFGVFCKRIPKVMVEYWKRHGAREVVADYVQKAFENSEGIEAILAAVEKMNPTDGDRGLANMARGYGPVANTPAMLEPLAPFIFNVHGKFYEMTEHFVENSIPYEQIIPALVKIGYSGSIDSEYEGQRWTQDAFPTDSCEQVRREHVMLRRLLGEIA
ncbi:MAG: TIM barrel protein [Steroidobacteraceae bacterium]